MLFNISADVLAIIRRGTDVSECLAIAEAELLSQDAPIVHEQVLDVLKVSRVVVIAEQWQPLASFG